jgi:hypothetical protein
LSERQHRRNRSSRTPRLVGKPSLRNRVEPRQDRRLAVALGRQRGGRGREDLLGQILGSIVVAGAPTDVPIDGGVVAPERAVDDVRHTPILVVGAER